MKVVTLCNKITIEEKIMSELLYTRNTNKELIQSIPTRFDHMELLHSDKYLITTWVPSTGNVMGFYTEELPPKEAIPVSMEELLELIGEKTLGRPINKITIGEQL